MSAPSPEPVELAGERARTDWTPYEVVFRLLILITLPLALLGVVVPGDVGIAIDTVVVVVLVATPLVRVVALVVRWRREGDRRFVLVGVVLLAIVGLGALLAVLRA